MGSQYKGTDINFPIRVSSTQQPSKSPARDLHRYWRSNADEGYLERYWPDDHSNHDDWITIVRRLVAPLFPEFANAEVRYVAKGTFNRLYSLSAHNLLVDRDTFTLTAVIDWECVSVVPAFETYDAVPAFLSDREWIRPTPLVLLAHGIPPNDEVIAADRLRREAEMGPARRAYHRIVGPLYDITTTTSTSNNLPGTRERVKGKQGLAKQLEIASFQHRPWWTAAWLAENGFGEDKRVGVIFPPMAATMLWCFQAIVDDGGDTLAAYDSERRVRVGKFIGIARLTGQILNQVGQRPLKGTREIVASMNLLRGRPRPATWPTCRDRLSPTSRASR
ncbi:uncharacterized protein B0T15DRAFT_503481 [Chaetomium strumarium]|uniref:Aminoglycoside phosphotransferase domain-containing protein n=1 Tax=Chaetomium strumarium TaxID=1170767 RepID=A0AAJ0M077_9PEZI|nr:hypothetical protein B0T15DRAFT_503481 [Chaetomium strumarium]